MEQDELFSPGKSSYRQPTVMSPENQEKHPLSTRSQMSSPLFSENDDNHECGGREQFPQIRVRTAYKSFNIDIIEALELWNRFISLMEGRLQAY